MSLPLEFHPEVGIEVESAFRWYEVRLPGLGHEFLDAVQHVLEEIELNPARFGFGITDIREGLLKRFPYTVQYRVLSDRIRVLAVCHTSRDSSRWMNRD